MSEKYSGLTPRISEIITSPQLGSSLEPQEMAPSVQTGESSVETTVVIHSVFPTDDGESDHKGWNAPPLAAN